MDVPRILYGVHLGSLPHGAVKLPKRVLQEDGTVHVELLATIAKAYELSVIRSDTRIAETELIDSIHVGYDLPLKTFTLDDLASCDLSTLILLHRTPARVLVPLRKLGIVALKEHLRLYCACDRD